MIMRSVRAEEQQNAPKQSPRRGPGRARLEAYLAVGVSSLGLASSASAGVISIDLSGLTGANAGVAAGGYKILSNFPVSGDTAYLLNGYGSKTVTGIAFNQSGIATLDNGNARPKNFAAGATIDGNNLFNTGYASVGFRAFGSVSADVGANSFLGFKTDNGRFGYIEVTWTAATNTFFLQSTAYESEIGVAILANATSGGGGGEVPEPASGAIAVLLMGGTALRQWRKKRRQESNEAVAS